MGKRVGILDEVRGIAYIAMILYHAYYDIVFVYGVDLPDAADAVMRFIQPFIAGTFIFVAGASSVYSGNNFKRGATYFFLAMALTFVTAVVMPSEIIIFGVLHFLGIAAMIYGFIGRYTEKIPWLPGMILFALLFAAAFNIPRGFIGFEGILSADMPDILYGHYWLFPLGFVSSGFYSADYFPLIPYLFLFLAGSSLGVYFRSNRAPKGFYMTRFSGMSFLGRHGLWIYMLHQPVLILILDLYFKLTGGNTVFL
ncbi:MAG: DUF1624 domain-containing protein [Ruminiclostridium sp.]|nr:DUF1624 domain-containing protein [Ruminiclostridium sp.]